MEDVLPQWKWRIFLSLPEGTFGFQMQKSLHPFIPKTSGSINWQSKFSPVELEKLSRLPPKKLTWIPKMMVGKGGYFWIWPFLASMLDFWGVLFFFVFQAALSCGESLGVSSWCVLYTRGRRGEHVSQFCFFSCLSFGPSLGWCGDVSK